jgi:hypothetical protein
VFLVWIAHLSLNSKKPGRDCSGLGTQASLSTHRAHCPRSAPASHFALLRVLVSRPYAAISSALPFFAISPLSTSPLMNASSASRAVTALRVPALSVTLLSLVMMTNAF